MQAAGSPRDNTRNSPAIGLTGVTLYDLSRLLAQSGHGLATIRNSAPNDDDDEADNDDEYSDPYRQAHKWFPEVTKPQKAGVELLRSGDFGRVADKLRSRRSDINVAKLVYKRSLRPELVSYKEDYASVRISDIMSSLCQYSYFVKNLIPNSNGTTVASYDANIYTGQYSTGNDI